MFQNFDVLSDPSTGEARVACLREAIRDRGLDGLVVPYADEHQSEYLPENAERLRWLTGFSGSAGAAIVTADKAVIFVDGRYTIQVREQVDVKVFEICHLIEHPPADWLKANAANGARIGYDPWLHTLAELERLKAACDAIDAELVPLDGNLIDAVWEDRPAPPLASVALHDASLAGEDRDSKIKRIAKDLSDNRLDAAVLTMSESAAWLFNIRGGDVSHTPLVLSNVIVRAEGRPTLFVDGRKLTNAVRDTLADACDIEEPSAFSSRLEMLGTDKARVSIDRASTPVAVKQALEAAGAEVVLRADPCQLPRAIKNATEIEGARNAHLRDAVPYARFLAWLDREAPGGDLDEIKAAVKLEELRAETGALRDLSFDTISSYGPNGAINHYRVNTATNLPLEGGSLYLVDSGAQYEDGTTDITRTIAIGTPTAEMVRCFTLVLKGMIAISIARFPKGATGAQLDSFARDALWRGGLDYDHGTGHGVGSYLGVHEGPQRIAKTGTTPLQTGMILSNEPGYYKAGAFGIRIENLIVVTEPSEIEGGDRPMFGFETLTWAPIDRRLIDAALLSADELDWLNAYHAEVFDKVGSELDTDDREWLKAATAPIRT